MMKPIFATLIAAACVVGIAGCGDTSTMAENIDHAQTAIDNNDYVSAGHYCDVILKADSADIDVNTLCLLSIIYMKINDGSPDHDDSNIQMAQQCYTRAYAADSAAAAQWYSRLPVDDIPHISLLSSLVKAAKSDSADLEALLLNDTIDYTDELD